MTDPAELERIAGLVIPPAWSDVWISLDPRGHIQAVGTDAAGRRQYLYHERWRARRDAQKFDRMVQFARALPSMRERVAHDLRRPGMPRERTLACAVRLLDQAFFRVGSEAYARRNGSFGLATLRREHVRVTRDTIAFDFRAKSGKRLVHEVRDPDLVAPIRTMKRRRAGGRDLLAYREGDRWRDVRSSDVNVYLRDVAGGDYTAKDFRTWHGTVLGAVSVARNAADAPPGAGVKRIVSASVRDVAELLGNTPAVARASYIDPRVFERFEQGRTIADTLERLRVDEPTDPAFRDAVERAVLALIGEGPAAPARAA